MKPDTTRRPTVTPNTTRHPTLQERLLTCEFVETPSRLSAREMSESTSWYVLGGGKYDGTEGSCIIPSILLPWSVTVTNIDTNHVLLPWSVAVTHNTHTHAHTHTHTHTHQSHLTAVECYCNKHTSHFNYKELYNYIFCEFYKRLQK